MGFDPSSLFDPNSLASVLAAFGGGNQSNVGAAQPQAPSDAPITNMQAAQAPVLQISPRGNGQYAVINVTTGQIVYVGTLDGARNAQANGQAVIRRKTID